jgi:hypothetical protein
MGSVAEVFSHAAIVEDSDVSALRRIVDAGVTGRIGSMEENPGSL